MIVLLQNQTIGPFDANQLNQLNQAIQDFSPEQKIWLSGYLAGQSLSLPQTAVEPQPQGSLTVLYGSQTGNAKNLAQGYAEHAQSQGINAKLISLADYKPRQISKESHLVLLVSTHGEGDAPDDAEIFYEYLFSDKAPQLTSLKYSVLALGDSSYEQFCQTGVDIDEQLHKLGAERIFERIDCDLDYEDDAEQWKNATVQLFSKDLKSETNNKGENNNIAPLSLIKNDSQVTYDRNNTFASEILTIQKITTQQSVKNVYHIELSIEGSDMAYQVGDSIGIMANNDASLVSRLIELIDADGNDIVQYKGQEYPLQTVLTSHCEITLLNKKFLNFYAEHINAKHLKTAIETHEGFNHYVENRQLIDVLKEYPSAITAQHLVDNLTKITPRLYSIASSHNVYNDEVHLTVSLVESGLDSVQKDVNSGLVSGLLCARSQEGDTVNVYVESNNNFRLPEDTNTDVIMIGAGTGIAPYRAFLQERQAQNATGKNWLFFGNPSFDNDFLYQLELQKFQQKHLLNRIDLAFSRDQAEKIYVQHKVKEQGKELWQWLQQGAHLYICGNADYMAKDVEQALIEVISQYGQMNQEHAQNHLKQLKRNHRYQKDIY